MTASVRAFLDGLIDYAGLFPPASLGMREAVAVYARHLRSDHAWMVNRFICPVNRLDVFAAVGREALWKFSPVKVSGLASPMIEVARMTDVAAKDAAMASSFEEDGWGVVEVLEARLPDDLIMVDAEEIRNALDRYEAALRLEEMRIKRIFYEIARTPAWSAHVERCATACSGAAHRGFKIRCGGLTPDAYPTVEEVAEAIAICARLGVPFKATAGLHKPVRHERSESGITQHGFVNIFVAGILASQSHSSRLKSVIDDRSLQHFEFTDDYLAWQEYRLPLDTVRKVRGSFAISYGSCDIDEPVEDLEWAGLL